MKLSIVLVVASILIIGLVDFSDATFLPPPPCPPPKPPKPPVKPPKPPVKPPVKPCEPPKCGPGGPNCLGCPNQDNLCKDLIKTISDLENKIKKCVCGVKFV